MTEQEKIRRHDALQNLRKLIGACFGQSDGIFADHPSDESSANDLKELAIKNGIETSEFREIALIYLFNQEFPVEHIKKQLEKVSDFFK
jgi:hypothetical protein